ncbi:MAG TPA: alanine racemase [Rhizomicrobium sp.]|nr:alanine racemase [Rhizomicrobium sp.]
MQKYGMTRRAMLAGAAATLGAHAAVATPALSVANFGLRPRDVPRRNAWFEIDAAAFEHNIAQTRAILGPGGAELCAIMKADAYGNGLDLLMPSVLKTGIKAIGFASNEEARIARAMNFKGRLVRVRTATPDEIEDAFPFAVEELVGNPAAAQRIADLWRGHDKTKVLPIHLCLNADGMSRNGVELKTDYGKADARAILAVAPLKIAGLMTHYPTEDRDDILRQLARFESDIAWLRANGLPDHPMTRHTANTFATLHHPETRLDMVRVGGALYGDTSADFLARFRPTITLKSRVAAVNHFPAEETVNYDRTFRLSRESWLANIPIGYSDGYRRSLSHANQPDFADEGRNNTQVLIGGRRYPLVGRVTMNTLMADVTGDQDRVKLDDEVVLFGHQGDEVITQKELETNASAYGPDLLAVMGNSLPKILKSA